MPGPAPGGKVAVFSPNRLYPFETHGTFLRNGGRRVPHWVPLVPYLPLPLGRLFLRHWARNYWPGELRRRVRAAGFRILSHDFVWQTFENISGRQPEIVRRLAPVLRRIAGGLERAPLLRAFGASQVIVAERPRAGS